MRYILDLDSEHRVLSAKIDSYYVEEQVRTNKLPSGCLMDYKFIDGEFIYAPVADIAKKITPLKNNTD